MKNTSDLTNLIDAIVEEFDFPKHVIYEILEDFDFVKINNQDAEWLINEFKKDEENAMDIFSVLYTDRAKLKEAKRIIKNEEIKKFNRELINDFLTCPELAATRKALGI